MLEDASSAASPLSASAGSTRLQFLGRSAALGLGGLLPVAGPFVRGTSAGRDTEPLTRDR